MNVLDRKSYFAKFKNVLLEEWGTDEDSAVWKDADELSKKLLDENPKAVKDSRTVAYPMAGIYLALQKKVSKDKALELMMDYAYVAGEDAKNRMAKMTGFPGIPKLIWKNREAIMRSAGSEKKGYKSRIIEVSDEYCDYYITRE